MAGASYDGELGNLNDGLVVGGGVFYFENVGGQMQHLRLGRDSQSLAVALLDIDQDGRRDIIVGNDFELADYVFYNTADGWREAEQPSPRPPRTL